jgi:hypothetical protein
MNIHARRLLSLRLAAPGARLRGALLLTLAASSTGCVEMVERIIYPNRGATDGSGVDEGLSEATAVERFTLEEEPANSSETSPPQIAPGARMEGTLALGDIDAYRLGAGPPVNVQIELEQGGELRVHVPSTGAVQRYELIGGTPLVIDDLPREEALHLVLTGQGAWTLRIDPVAAGIVPRCGFALETGEGGGAGAELVAIPARISGCIDHTSDRDEFVVSPDAWRDVPLFGIRLTGVPGVAMGMSVRDALGNSVAELMGQEGQSIQIPNLGPPLDGGPLTIEVVQRQGAGERSAYMLELRRPPGLLGAIEVEPNNSPAHATVVNEIGVINGYIHRPGDTDYYRLEPAETQVVRLRADAPEFLDLQLLLDEHTTYGTATINEEGEGGQEALCSMRVGPEAPLHFAVQGLGVATTFDSPYLVHFDLYSGSDFEVEPNDRLEMTAAAEPPAADGQSRTVWFQLAPGVQSATAAGHIFPATERDVFAMDIAGDPRASVTYHSIIVRLDPGPLADYSLELLDDRGAIVSRSERGRMGEVEVVSADLSSGRYYVRVSMTEGDGCQTPYRLSAEQRGFPPPPAPAPAFVEGSGASEGSGELGLGVAEIPPIDLDQLEEIGSGDGDAPSPPPRPGSLTPRPRPGFAPDGQTANPTGPSPMRVREVERRAPAPRPE